MNWEKTRGLILTLAPVAMIGALVAAGVPLVLAGMVVAGASVITLITEMLKSAKLVTGDMYWPTLFAGWGLLLVFLGLALKGVIPVPLQITGDPLIDAVIVSTITSAITVTMAFFLPKLYSRLVAKSVLPFETPYLER